MVDSDPHDGPNQLRNDQSSQINKFQSMDSGEEDAPTELEMRGIREELPPIDPPKDLPIHCDEVGVHRLPVELLEQTFCYLPYLDHLPGTSKSCPQYDWIAITEVCKHWHDVAVNCRDLWTLIPLINEKLAQAALARSSSAEIRIVAIARGRLELNIGSEPSLAATRAALRHLSRTRELVLDQLCYDFRTAAQTAWDIEKVLDLLESNAATSLRTLYITSRSFMTIPEEIFKGEMPRLTSVTLDRCLLPHSTFSRAPITSLSISRTHINGDEREFLLILENMPLLQYLDIRGVIYMSMPRTDEPPKFALRPIHLPHLRRLSVECRCVSAALRLSITYPRRS
ncbi:hypothetical protein OF83DRAFT_449776 [Amylostereum chailletii]|nr:hypothetical protein OF83DRAFT_449776 [Amylostereum chailletii]